MRLRCKNCEAKYKVADDKISGRLFKFRCRRCGVIIVVDDFEVSIEEAAVATGAALPLEDGFIESFCGLGAASGYPRLFVSVKPPARLIEAKGSPFHWSVPIDNLPWYVLIDDKPVGPMNARRICDGYLSGQYSESDLVWKEGMPDWISLGNCKSLIGLVAILGHLEHIRASKRLAENGPAPEETVTTDVAVKVDMEAPEAPQPVEKSPPAEPKVVIDQAIVDEATRDKENGNGDILIESDEAKMIHAFEQMQGIYSVQEHDDAAQFALSLARRLVDCEAGVCMLLAPRTDQLYMAAAEGPISQSLHGVRIATNRGVVGEAVKVRSAVNISDPSSDPRFDPEVDSKRNFNTRNMLCVPLHYKGQIIGSIELLNSPKERGFADDDVHVLTYIATALAEFTETSLPERDGFSEEDFLVAEKS